MDIEKEVINTVLVTGDILPAIEAKIRPEWFEGDLQRRVWDWILQFWQQYGEAPTEGALKRAYPTFKIRDPEDPYEFLIDEFRARRKHTLVMEGLTSVIDLVNEASTDQALSAMTVLVTDVSAQVAALRDTDISNTWEQRMDAYEDARENRGKLRGIPMGFEHLDTNLGGMQAEQLITLVGLPKSGKSATLLKMAICAHDAGSTVLFVGFEMSNQEQEARHDAMVAGLDHWKLLHGYLSAAEMRILKRALKARQPMKPFVLSSDLDAYRVSDLTGLVERYKPDVLFVDGVYLMEDDRGQEKGTPQALTNITRDLKRVAQRVKMPVVITTQALLSKTKGGKVTAHSVGYTGSFVQDSDVVLGVETMLTDDGKPIPHQKRIFTVAARSAPHVEIIVDWDWSTGSFEERAVTDDSQGVQVDEDGEVVRGTRPGDSISTIGRETVTGDGSVS